MRSATWTARMAALAGISTLSWWAAVALPAAPAGAADIPGHGAAVRAAAGPAPLVPDVAAPGRSKVGLAAPAMSARMLAANSERQVSARNFLRMLRQNGTAAAKCTSPACRTGLPAARNLAATQQAQVRNYYCGPATVAEMLAQLGKHVSQATAARELKTNPSGTDWSDNSGYPVPDVLNQNQHRNDYVAVALPWSPTTIQVQDFETDLVTDVNHNGGVPLAGNAYEVAGGPHLAGHPVNQTIFHWFDIRGYSDYGRVADYEDTVHGASSIGWSAAVPAYSAMSSRAIVNILGARGYAW